jgi:hypothetical protein
MAAKPKQVYAPFKTTTPKLESYYHNLTEPDQYSDKYDIGVVIDDSPECKDMVDRLIAFQNECLDKDGRDMEEDLICLKDEKEKDEATGKWTVKTGRKLLFFKSAEQSKFDVVGPDKKPIDPQSFGKGSTVRVNGGAAYGTMQGKPYITLYLNAVQLIVSSGSGGVDAFDDETEGQQDETPFSNESDDVVGGLT